MSAEQQDIEGLAVDYARPPEAKPTDHDRKVDRLAQIAHRYNDAERTGEIRGVLAANRRHLAAARRQITDAVIDVVETTAAEVEAELRKRYGDEHVDREKRLHEGENG